jgi:hypothetical protein
MSEPHPQRPVRGPARFREKDVVRVLRAAQKSNTPVAAVKITVEGDILIIPGTPEPVPSSEPNPFDK